MVKKFPFPKNSTYEDFFLYERKWRISSWHKNVLRQLCFQVGDTKRKKMDPENRIMHTRNDPFEAEEGMNVFLFRYNL